MHLSGPLILIAATGLLAASPSEAPLNLPKALEIVERDNLEIKAAHYDLESAHADAHIADGYHWGRLDLVQDIIRSNHAGNVFGFKLSAREAAFADFGFNEFLTQIPALIGGTPGAGDAVLATQPDDLNNPDAYTFYQTKLTYQLPIFVGGKLSAYSNITEAAAHLKRLDKKALIDEKRYQTRKSFYDMALLKSSVNHFTTILGNIKTLENITETMLVEGYAKHTDLLEVQAKRTNVERMLSQMHSNEELLYHYISFLLNRPVKHITPPEEDVPMCFLSDDEILQNNIDLKKAQTGLKITDEMVSVAYAPFLPQVGAFAELSTADDSFLGDANDHKAYTVGAQLSWNLFHGGVDYNGYEKARIGHLKMKTQLQLAQKGIALKLHQIRTEVKELDYEVKSLNKELELATEIYHNYEGRYREHLTSMSDVLIKQSQQIEKTLELLMTKNKRNERIFALHQLANGDTQ